MGMNRYWLRCSTVSVGEVFSYGASLLGALGIGRFSVEQYFLNDRPTDTEFRP